LKRYIGPVLLLLAVPWLLFAKDYRQVTYQTENAGKVIFDHDVHVRKLKNDCTVCHNSLYQIGKKNPVTTMAEMEQGKSCGTCHNKVKAFHVAECVRCHIVKEVPIVIPDFGTLIFSHKFHLGLYSCGDCHNKIFRAGPGNPHVTMKQMEEGRSCGVCHDSKTAFSVKGDCTRCHAVKDIPFAAADPFSHTFHLKMFACGDCHSALFIAGPKARRATMREMEKGESCGGCHEGKTAFSVKGDCQRCHSKVGDVAYKESRASFPHAYHLTIYRCGDCHSGLFTAGPRRTAYTMADMEKKTGRSCGACHEGEVAFSAHGSCDRCHTSTKELEWKVPRGGRVVFSHTYHVNKKLRCDDCHFGIFPTGTMAKRFTMSQMEKGESCGACHDGKGAFSVSGSCGRCHPVREIDFVKDASFSHTFHYALYSCTACHNRLFKDEQGNRRYSMVEMEGGLSCGGCHNEKDAFGVTGNCGRCHHSSPELVIQVRDAGATPFSHKLHAGMYKCDDCHNKVFTTGVAARRYSMAQMEAGKSCGACHNDKDAFTAKANCTRCHPVKDITYKSSGGLFKHSVHIAIYRCNDCHDKIFVPGPGRRPYTMPDMEAGKSCGACHDGKQAFSVKGDCDKCHPNTKAIKYEFPAQKTVNAVIFSHKYHKEKEYKCPDCHYRIYATGVNRRSYTMKEMGEGKSCGVCHSYNITGSPNCAKCHSSETSIDLNWDAGAVK
jgi:c(7)-type cytochrome triheme protein